jgi:hypothetical protein
VGQRGVITEMVRKAMTSEEGRPNTAFGECFANGFIQFMDVNTFAEIGHVMIIIIAMFSLS